MRTVRRVPGGRALAFVSRWFDPVVVATTFEPLIADWQRECEEVQSRGSMAIARVLLSGGFAFARTIISCALMSGSWIPPFRSAIAAATGFGLAALTPVILYVVFRYQFYSDYTGPLQSVAFILMNAPAWVSAAVLPAMFILHRDRTASWRHAITALVIMAALTGAVSGLTTQQALRGFFSTPAWMERQHQWALANDRAGRYQYPGTASRQMDRRSPAERRAGYARIESMVRADIGRTPLTRADRIALAGPVVFALLLGAIGWSLARSRPTFAWMAAWWLLFLLLVLLNARARPALTFATLAATVVAITWIKHSPQVTGVKA